MSQPQVTFDPGKGDDITVYTVYGYDVAAEQMEHYLSYLDTLRESSETNMFGAGPYLSVTYGLEPEFARAILMYWMNTFSERHSKETPMSRFLIFVDEQAKGSLDLLTALSEQCQSFDNLGDGTYSAVGEPASIIGITNVFCEAVLKCEQVQ